MGSEVSVDAATTQTGFVRKNGSWYYYDKNGKLAKGWYQTKSGTRYYFGKTGAAKSGILTVNGKSTALLQRENVDRMADHRQ